ncbi:hypothetical protein X741_02865 [Mesorhizobium sp. LNHC229A00]|nr:hypothetical protein X741_02865 [Mesorhizobium sp. LNHC229A00]
MMTNRATILQLIAAVITICLMAVLHDWLGWYLHRLDPKFLQGLAVGICLTIVIVLMALWYDHRKSVALTPREQQRTRNIIDL